MNNPLKITRRPITVLKVGGARLASQADLERLSEQVVEQRHRGHQTIIVHGGGPEISELHEQLEIPFEKVNGLRATSERGMDATAMVLCGLVRTRIVQHFTARGMDCLGVSGVDRGLLRARFLDRNRLGRVGAPPTVDGHRFRQLLELGAVLVVSPVSMGPDGSAVNVNADDAAHAIATALDASSLDFVSDIPGVRTADDLVVRHLDPPAVSRLIADGVVRGGMVPKLKAAVAAVRSGVDQVRIGDLASMAAGRATVISSERPAA